MNNKQLAAARRVANRYPQFRMVFSGDTLTPYNGDTAGDPVTVLATTTPEAVGKALSISCAVLANG